MFDPRMFYMGLHYGRMLSQRYSTPSYSSKSPPPKDSLIWYIPILFIIAFGILAVILTVMGVILGPIFIGILLGFLLDVLWDALVKIFSSS